MELTNVVDAENAVKDFRRLEKEIGEQLFELEANRLIGFKDHENEVLVGRTLYAIDARLLALSEFCKKADQSEFWKNMHWYLLPVLLHYDMRLITNFDGVIRRLRRIFFIINK